VRALLRRLFGRSPPAPPADPVAARLDHARLAFGRGEYEMARLIWETLAEDGVPRALANLGGLYAEALGVARNDRRAVELFERAARAGDALAAQNLAVMHAEGRGTAGNPAEAVRWYLVAAQAGLVESQRALAWIYAEGVGVPPDPDQARHWAAAAARPADDEEAGR
jgi:TPR repeat protein